MTDSNSKKKNLFSTDKQNKTKIANNDLYCGRLLNRSRDHQCWLPM